MILEQFIVTATTYVQLNSRNAAKSKAFGDFFQNLYELYNTCAVELHRTTLFLAYSKLMITSYRLYDSENSDGSSTATTTVAGYNDDDNEFQKALDFGEKKMNEKVQLQSDKNAKKTESTKGGTQQTQKKKMKWFDAIFYIFSFFWNNNDKMIFFLCKSSRYVKTINVVPFYVWNNNNNKWII